MKVKVANIAFVILFMALLLVPLLRADFSGGKTSQQERRVLALRPPLQYMTPNTSDFIKQFDAWFSDNLGLREPIVTLYNKLNSMYSQGYYLDGESVVFIGKEGHHFHSNDNQITPIYQGKPWLSEQQLKDFSNGLNEIDQYLSSKGIPLKNRFIGNTTLILLFAARNPVLSIKLLTIFTRTQILMCFVLKKDFSKRRKIIWFFQKQGSFSNCFITMKQAVFLLIKN